MNWETWRRIGHRMKDRADETFMEAEAIRWAEQELIRLNRELDEATRKLTHLRKVCDDNRWPYDKE